MPELDHHHEPVSLHDCAVCQDRGIEVESREYCQACYCGKRRKNTDAFAEKLRVLPFTDALWIVAHANIKTERAIAAAELALLKSKLLQAERELIAMRKDVEARKLNPLNPFYDIEKDKEFREDFARLAEQGVSKKQRGIILRGVMQAIHAYAADEARKAVAASVAQANKEQG